MHARANGYKRTPTIDVHRHPAATRETNADQEYWEAESRIWIVTRGDVSITLVSYPPNESFSLGIALVSTGGMGRSGTMEVGQCTRGRSSES